MSPLLGDAEQGIGSSNLSDSGRLLNQCQISATGVYIWVRWVNFSASHAGQVQKSGL